MATLVLTMAPFTAGALRRFTITVDGVEVARLRLGRSCSIEVEPGHHVVSASIDWHSGRTELETEPQRTTRVGIEYAALVTQSHQRRDDAFRFTVTRAAPS